MAIGVLKFTCCQPVVSFTAVEFASRVPAADQMLTTVPIAVGVLWYFQCSVPVACRHVAPSSSDTSAAPTAPPTSFAVPWISTGVPTGTVAPTGGLVMAEVGGVLSIAALWRLRLA